MTAGLQVFDSSGNTVIDTTTRVAVLVAEFLNVTTNQSQTVANLTTYGSPFSFVVNINSYASGSQFNNPVVSISGNTVSWTYEAKSGATNQVCNIYIGVR